MRGRRVRSIHNTTIEKADAACQGGDVAAARKRARREGPGRPIDAPGPIGDLARALGSWQELAELLGCSLMTVQRWARDIHEPNLATKRELNRLAKKHRTALPYPDVT